MDNLQNEFEEGRYNLIQINNKHPDDFALQILKLLAYNEECTTEYNGCHFAGFPVDV